MDSADPRQNFGRIRNFGGAGEGENSDGSRTSLSRVWGWNWRCLVNSNSGRRPGLGMTDWKISGMARGRSGGERSQRGERMGSHRDRRVDVVFTRVRKLGLGWLGCIAEGREKG